MLLQLEFKNLATFPSARLELASGLNILSGMSGAGKSVLLRALALALGGRFSQKLIRNGEEKSEVSALFVLEPHLVEKWKEELSLESDEIIIRRQFKREGRTLNYVNDSMIGIEKLQRLGASLAQTLDQDEAMGLRDPSHQLAWLDVYGGIKLDAYKKCFSDWRGKVDKLNELKESVKTESQQRQFIEFQYEEISKLNLEEGETLKLEEEHRLLANSVEIEQSGSQLIESGEAFSSDLLMPLERLGELLGDHPHFSDLIEEGKNLQIGAEEWSRTMRSSLGEIESDPSRLFQTEERLRALRAIFKKFQMDELELIAHVKELEEKLSSPPAEIEMQKLEEEIKKVESEAKEHALKLHQQRKKASTKLTKEINKKLATLEMEGNRFSIDLEKESVLNSKGLSVIDFKLKPTADGPAMPLAECASGGERSRALLSISSALSKSMGASLLVFDEIDTNIGSRLGRPISEAFISLSESTQVICVTHLAPVAACGEKHFIVEKGPHHSGVRELVEQERLEELAQMIAGEKNSVSALEQAEHMLSQFQGNKA